MKIIRDSKEYELTSEELQQAFCEQQHLNDVAYVDYCLWEYLSDEELKKLGSNSEFIDETAYGMRTFIDELGMSFDLSMSRIIDEIKDKYLNYDRLFYSIDEIDGKKIIHVLSEIYCIDCGEEKDYRLVEFTGTYLEFDDIQKHRFDLIEHIYDNFGQVYEKDMSKAEADECCKSYFEGKEGVELSVFKCVQNTPCGNYWCEADV